MSAESQRFAQLLLARLHRLGLETDREVAEAGGPSTTTMTKIRAAARDPKVALPRPRADGARRIDRAANWAPGSARRVYDGGEATPLEYARQDLVMSVQTSNLSEADKARLLELLTAGRPPEPDRSDIASSTG